MTWCSIWKTIVFLSYFKTEVVTSKEVTAENHLPSSTKFSGRETEKFSFCFFSLNSSVSYGFVFVCSINVYVCFLVKSYKNYPSTFECLKTFSRYDIFNEFFVVFWNFFILFSRIWTSLRIVIVRIFTW